jgi:hypothetical protein
MGKNVTKPESEPPRRSLFSLLSESKPQASQQESYLEQTSYNENYNYAYQSIDSDELMMIEEKFDGDNNNMLNARALPHLPVFENSSTLGYDTYG